MINPNTPWAFDVSFFEVMNQTFSEAVIYDVSGAILFVNQGVETAMGLPRQEMVGTSIDMFGAMPGQEAFYNALKRAMETGKKWQGKVRCRPADGGPAKCYATTISPLQEKTGKGLVFLAVRKDVSELEQREKQVMQAGKMEAIGILAGGIAHDFNNVLAGIVGYAELVKEDLDALEAVGPKTHGRLDNMISGAMRAKTLIQQILTFSRVGQETRVPVSAGHLIKEVVELLRASLPATIHIDVAMDSQILVLAEPTQIHQIAMNLGTNARDAMMVAGGVLSISLTKTGAGKKGGGQMRLRVADTGPGIDPKIRHKVVDPFFTTKPLDRGTGMGLFVVHGIVSGLGGRIDIQDNDPQGAVIDVFLPLYQGRKTCESETAEFSPPVRGNGEHILFVDDETDLIDIAEDGLSSIGYQVTGFDDSLKALDWFQVNPKIPDLLITDVTMPGITGDRLMQKMKTLRPDLPVLLITGASEWLDRERVKKLGAETLLQKPMVIGEMAAAIQQALDRRKHGPDSDH
jgi:PAS domain S-box-containing protein